MTLPTLSTLAREVRTTQVFSRRGVGYLWSKREELDASQTAIVDSIYKNRKKGLIEGQQVITYKLAKSKAGQLGYGRLFGQKGSLETLKRECRGTICREYYHDLDVVNAHPVFLVQFAKAMYSKDLPEVERYCDQREEFLARVSSNRDEAKEEIIKVFYGGKPQHEFLQPLYAEVRAFTKFVMNQSEYADLYAAIKHEDNIYGTFLSYLLQTYERAVMLSMRKSLEKNGWRVDVLAYDGVMVRKDPVLSLPEALRSCEADVLSDTGFRVKIVEKEMDAFEIPHDKEEIVAGVLKEDYERMKLEFERDHFYFVPTNQYAELEDGIIHLYDCDHAREYFKAKWRFIVSDKFNDFVEFFLLYRNDASRRTIKEVDYQARPDEPWVFTPPLDFLYKVSLATPQEEALSLFTTLLRINSGNDPVLYDWLLKYNAHMLQFPFDLTGVAIVITGKKGTGKDSLYDFFIEFVIGTKFAINYQSNQQFFEKHDVGRENKFLIKLEEADRKYCIENASALKSMITAKKATFNPKGKKPYGANNYGRFIFTTNKPNPMDMSDEERRFVITACSPDKKGDFAFWKEVRTKLFTEEAGKAVADYLLKVDLTGYNVRDLPTTNYQQQVVESEMTAEDLFVSQWDGAETSAHDLYTTYRSWCIENNHPYVPSALVFGKRLLQYTRDGVVSSVRRGGNKNYYWKP